MRNKIKLLAVSTLIIGVSGSTFAGTQYNENASVNKIEYNSTNYTKNPDLSPELKKISHCSNQFTNDLKTYPIGIYYLNKGNAQMGMNASVAFLKFKSGLYNSNGDAFELMPNSGTVQNGYDDAYFADKGNTTSYLMGNGKTINIKNYSVIHDSHGNYGYIQVTDPYNNQTCIVQGDILAKNLDISNFINQ